MKSLSTIVFIFLFCIFFNESIIASENNIFNCIKNADYKSFEAIKSQITDWNIKDEAGNTPLICAFVKFYEIELQKRGKTALHYAVLNKDIHLIDQLIENGADVFAKDENGDSPYLLARKSGLHEIADTMIDFAADDEDNKGGASENTSDEKGSVDKKVFSEQARNILLIIDNLLYCGSDVNTADRNGRNAFHYAVLSGNYDLVKKLLNKNIDINKQDNLTSATPLIIAARTGEWAIADLLIEKNADVNLKENVKPEFTVHKIVQENDEVYAKPADYNFKFIVKSINVNDPDKDLKSYYKIFIDKQEQGRTLIGLESQIKDYTGKLSVNSHLLTVEKYVLDEKQERYVKLNNIDQPNPNFYYFDIPADRIVIISLKHDNDNKTAEFTLEYEKKQASN